MCVPHVHMFKCTASRLKKGGLAIEGLGDCVCVPHVHVFKCTASRMKKDGFATEGLGDCVCVCTPCTCV